MSFILAPLSFIYLAITKVRNALFDLGILSAYRAKLPVLSVGNLTVGGNGKTPLVAFLVELLQDSGLRPAVVMRGYGGRERGPHLVCSEDGPGRVGDEALLLFHQLRVPVVVSSKRRHGIELVERQDLADVVVLDDGFQHRQTRRDLDILTHYIGGKKEVESFVSARVLPWGRFRESRDSALSRATCLVFASRSSEEARVPQEVLSLVPSSVAVFRSTLIVEGVFRSGTKVKNKKLKGPWVVVCAIANPTGFLTTVRGLGVEVLASLTFEDHHHFSSEDVRRIELQFPTSRFICTSKDMIKLGTMVSDRWYEVRTRNEIVPLPEFRDLILSRCGQ
jgi:tetraacyldisaccharide 4'-kinase